MLSVLISCSERHHMTHLLSDIENKYLAGIYSPEDCYLRAVCSSFFGFSINACCLIDFEGKKCSLTSEKFYNLLSQNLCSAFYSLFFWKASLYLLVPAIEATQVQVWKYESLRCTLKKSVTNGMWCECMIESQN